MDKFTFNLNTHINFGSGSRNDLKKIIKSENLENLCVVIDHALIDIPIFNEFLNSLDIISVLIKCEVSEPSYDDLEKNRKFLTGEKIDAFVGIGGGSALDMAKGLSVLYTNLGEAISYRGFEKFIPNNKIIIAIPTTSGTGSEITPNASFIDLKGKKKLGINGEGIRPKYAILDPELTLSCPKAATISAAIDSIVHSTEAFVALKSNSMAKIFSKQGFRIVFKSLPHLIENLDNLKSRESVMYGAFLSAISLMNSGTGPAAAMSYPIGVHFSVPHGIGGGICLPSVIHHNIKKGYKGYSQLLKSDNDLSFLEKLKTCFDIIGVPKSLNQYGIEKTSIEMLSKETYELSGAIVQNPVQISIQNIKNLFNEIID
jgi:alcohol dehydrogenase class IV